MLVSFLWHCCSNVSDKFVFNWLFDATETGWNVMIDSWDWLAIGRAGDSVGPPPPLVTAAQILTSRTFWLYFWIMGGSGNVSTVTPEALLTPRCSRLLVCTIIDLRVSVQHKTHSPYFPSHRSFWFILQPQQWGDPSASSLFIIASRDREKKTDGCTTTSNFWGWILVRVQTTGSARLL